MSHLYSRSDRHKSIRKMLEFWSEQPPEAKYFFVGMKTREGKMISRSFSRREFDQVAGYIEDYQSFRDIYVCPHGFTKRKRREQFAVDPRMFYADVDKADVERIRPKATYMVETSPGRYAGIWLTDKPVSVELNRRFTQYIKADPSGYDRTQYLRLIAGTTNFKREYSRPVVEMAYRDPLAQYSVSKIERLLPEATEPDEDIECEGAFERFTYEVARKIAKACKILAMWSQPVTADNARSSAIWRYGNEALEYGYRPEKAVCICEFSRAFVQKYDGRPRDGERELERLFRKFTIIHEQLRKQRRAA